MGKLFKSRRIQALPGIVICKPSEPIESTASQSKLSRKLEQLGFRPTMCIYFLFCTFDPYLICFPRKRRLRVISGRKNVNFLVALQVEGTDDTMIPSSIDLTVTKYYTMHSVLANLSLWYTNQIFFATSAHLKQRSSSSSRVNVQQRGHLCSKAGRIWRPISSSEPIGLFNP